VGNNFDRARLEHHDEDSSFPPAEPASFRPIPRPSGRPSRPSADGVAERFWNSQPQLSAPPPSLAPEPVRKPSPARSAFAKVLFVTLFGSIAALLGYAIITSIV
jgi:hypothetical protein